MGKNLNLNLKQIILETTNKSIKEIIKPLLDDRMDEELIDSIIKESLEEHNVYHYNYNIGVLFDIVESIYREDEFCDDYIVDVLYITDEISTLTVSYIDK